MIAKSVLVGLAVTGLVASQEARVPRAAGSDKLVNAARVVWDGLMDHLAFGATRDDVTRNLELKYVWSLRLLAAERALNPQSEKEALAAHLQRMTAMHDIADSMERGGRISALGLPMTEYYVAEAELWAGT